ncbi:MAG: S9 family peptidase [Simkaniaceae bacterium]|nr:S9 family peptidase [Simkaniaceae bacterium]
MTKAKPHGSWESPITTSTIVASSVKLGDIILDETELYWNEIRPEEKGRSVIVQWKNGKCQDILQAPYNARNRVHEYGGASFTVHNGTVYFSNYSDQGFYRLDPQGTVHPIAVEKNKRYANPLYDPARNVIYAVEEEHRSEHDVVNRLVKIGSDVEIIAEGEDFYSMPALHPNGTHLAFLSWNQPNMPWDETTLSVGKLTKHGMLSEIEEIAGGESESIFQPMWSKKGTLYYVSDRSGWWNIYQEGGECLYPMEGEFGQPLWVFGMNNYGFLEDGRIATVYTIQGNDFVGMIDPETKSLETLDLPFTSYQSFKIAGNALYFTAASPSATQILACYDIDYNKLQCIRKSKELTLDSGYISLPETIAFPTEDEKTAYGFFYPPKNKNCRGTDLPPLIVKIHGGPSAKTTPVLNLEIQFWTSRGFAYFDINYGGSTGYGREYRERLKRNWGVVDVADCVNGALYLVKQGKVDPNRMSIKGGSAGGYTTLAALTYRDVFKAGASYYGVSDLEALARGTHKFEAHYLEGLVGSYPSEKNRYRELSPIHHTEKLSSPVILFQGGEDKVVHPHQSEKIFKALKQKHTPVAYILFEKEQHGFRMAENIKKALDSELYFYGKIFQFEPSDALEPIKIHNVN